MIDFTDAEKLEKLELEELRIRRTRQAINQTYGEKQPTKKRHHLTGNRKWKNKRADYLKLEGQLSKDMWNLNTKRQEVLRHVFKNQKRLQDDQ